MRSLLAFVLLLTGVASAQDGLLPSPIPQDLRRYLELTAAQGVRIQQLNAQLSAYRSGKTIRQIAVQRELAEEMAREPLDPTAIGLRHVELESIRREIEAEQRKTMEEIQALLTPAQRTRLDGLAQVLRQQNTACAAVALNLLSAPSFGWDLGLASIQGWRGCPTIIGDFQRMPFPVSP